MEDATVAPALNVVSPVSTCPDTVFKVVSILLIIVICVLGIIGNIVAVVMAITQHVKTTTNFYLGSLAVADLIVLTSAGIPATTMVTFGYWVYGRYACPIITTFQYLGINTSPVFVAVITIERYITICHPGKAQALCTIPRAKKLIALLWTVTALYSAMWLYLADVEEVVSANKTYVVCGYRVQRESYSPIYLVDFCVFYAGPLLLMTVLYSLIAKALYGNPLPNNPSVQTEQPEDDEVEVENADTIVVEGREPRHDGAAVVFGRQVTKMMAAAVVVIMFALLWMPYRTLVVVNSFRTKAYVERGFLLFVRLCIYLNSAINPLIYSLTSLKFRTAIFKLLHVGGGPGEAPDSNLEQNVLLVGRSDCATAELCEFSATNRQPAVEKVRAEDGKAAATVDE